MYRLIEEKEVLLYGDEYWNEAAHHWFLLWSSAFGTLHNGSILIRRKISQDNGNLDNAAIAETNPAMVPCRKYRSGCVCARYTDSEKCGSLPCVVPAQHQ